MIERDAADHEEEMEGCRSTSSMGTPYGAVPSGICGRTHHAARRAAHHVSAMRPGDDEAASAVGMSFGAVAWGYTTFEALQACAPTVVFHEVEDIVVHLARNRAAP